MDTQFPAFPSSPFDTSFPVADDSLSAAYHRVGGSSLYPGISSAMADTRSVYPDPTPTFVTPGEYSSTVNSVPSFVRSRDPFILDPDPFGDKTREWGVRNGVAYSTDDVSGLNVFGKVFSREQLSSSAEGRELLAITTKLRQGRKRGFLDAITDFSLTDVPFFGMVASIGASVSDAVTVSDTLKKLQNGESITDDEALKTRLYMLKNEFAQTGGIGSMIGDIVRAAPGFMAEFALTGGALGWARLGAAKLAKDSAKWTATLAVDRSTKVLARELAQDALTRKLTKEVAAEATEQAAKQALRTGAANIAKSAAAKNGLIDEVAGDLLEYVTKSGVPAGISKDVARELAATAVNRKLAVEGASNMFTRFAAGTVNHLKEWTARGLLDHGVFGSETSTVMFTKHTEAGQALVDALGAFTVEAHLRGGLMFTPELIGHGVSALNESRGGDRLFVGRSELSLQESAYRQNDKALMDSARSIGLGMDFMEYVSENAGRGFGPLMRSVGLKLGLAEGGKQVIRHEAGKLVDESAAIETGGFLRKLIRKAVGTTDDFNKRIAGEENRAFARLVNKGIAEGKTGAPFITESEAARAIASGSTAHLSSEAASVVGSDVKAFMTRALENAYEGEVEDMSFKSMAQLRLVRWMAKHDLGPDAVMNAFDRMGYDGILGEMFEERYSDFEKGLLGWDDKHFETYGARVVDTVKGLYPGFQQLLAEAVGFAVPGVVRSGIMIAQRSIAGGSASVERDRRVSGSISAALNNMKHFQMERGDFEKQMDANIAALSEERARVEAERDAVSAGINDSSTEAEKNRLASYNERIAELRRREERQASHKAAVLNANPITTVDGAAEKNASDLIWVQAVDVNSEAGDFSGDKAFAVKDSTQIAGEAGALERARDGLVDMTMDIVETQNSIEEGAKIDPKSGLKQVGFWRWLGAKALGVAGAAVTGEIGLAFRNSSSWIGVDEGLPREFVKGLSDLGRECYTSEYKAMLRETAQSSTGTQQDHIILTDELRKRVRPKLDAMVKNYLDEWMAVTGTRFLTGTRGQVQAESIVAAEMGLSKDEQNGVVRWLDKSGNEVSADEVNARIREVKSEISRRTYAYLTKANIVDANTMDLSMIGKLETLDAVVFSDPLKPGRDIAVDQLAKERARLLAVNKAAMDNLGYKSIHVVANVDDDTTAAESLQTSGYTVTEDDLRGVLDDVANGLTESDDFAKKVLDLGRQMGFPEADGTDEQIKALRDNVIASARQLAAAIDARANVRVYVKAKETTESNSRFHDVRGNRIKLEAYRQSDGVSWKVTFTKDGVTKTKTCASRDELDAKMKEAGFDFVRRPIILTNVGAVRSVDGMCIARKLGLAEEIVNATQSGKTELGQATVHPFYRKNIAGEFAMDTDASKKQFNEELYKSWFWSVNGGDKPNLEAYDAVLPADLRGNNDARMAKYQEFSRVHANMFGENGYVSIMNSRLASEHVTCPTEKQYYAAYENGTDVAYSMKVDYFSAKTDDHPVIVSVDYGRMQDYSAAFLAATTSSVLDDFSRMLQMNTGIRTALTGMVAAAQRITQAELIAGHHTKQIRGKLKELNDFLTGRDKVVTKQVLSEVIRYIGFFQAEVTQDKNPDVSNPAGHDSAWLTVAPRIRNTQEYLSFITAVDIMFGGDAFGMFLARRATGEKDVPLSNTGIARILDIFGIPGGKSFENAISAIRPGGMDTAEFMREVSRRATQDVGKEKPQNKDTENTGAARYTGRSAVLANTIAAVIGSRKITNFADLRTAVADILGKVPFSKEEYSLSRAFQEELRALIEANDSLTAQRSSELADAKQNIIRLENDLKRARVSGKNKDTQNKKLEDELNKEREKTSALQRELEQLKDEKLQASAALKGGSSSADADAAMRPIEQPATGDTAEGSSNATADNSGDGSTPPVRKAPRVRRGSARIQLLDNPDIDFTTFGTVIPDGIGHVTVSEGFNVATELGAETPEGRETRKVGCAIIASAFRHMNRETGYRELSETEFIDTVRVLFGYNIRDIEINQMYQEYKASWANGHGDVYRLLADRPANDQNDLEDSNDSDEDRDANSSEDAYGTDKAKKAFENDALKRFLTFASFANPVTYREFQAFCLSLRTSIRRQLDIIKSGKPAAEEGGHTAPKSRLHMAYEFLDRVLNPRGQTGDLGRSAVDRQAQFTALLRELDSGDAGMTFDDILAELAAEDENGFIRSRQAVFLLSYLKALSPESREEMMTLVCSTADCSLGTMEEETVYDGKDSEGNAETHTELRMTMESNRIRCVSERAITSSFLHLAHGKRDLGAIVDSIRKDCESAKWLEYRRPATYAPLAYHSRITPADTFGPYLTGYAAYVHNSKVLSDILAKYFGRESALCEVLDNLKISSWMLSDLYSSMRDQTRTMSKTEKRIGVQREAKHLDMAAVAVSPRNSTNGNAVPGYSNKEIPLASTIIDILEALAREDLGGMRSEDTVARIVTAAFTYGVGNYEGGYAKHKQLSVNTPWMRLFEFHAASMPETLTHADLLPDRSNKTSATMAAAVAGIPPVIESWTDRSAADKGSFAWYAFKCLPEGHRDPLLFQGVTDAKSFDEKVMPWVRQNMCWPDLYHTPILFKNKARDYNKVEAEDACRRTFDQKYSTGMVTSWVTPVYNGDHSGGVYLRVPLLSLPVGGKNYVLGMKNEGEDAPKFGFTESANRILADMGLEKLASDSKRSSTTSSEAPGRSCYGVRHKNGKVIRGKTYIHLVHNYALGDHNDCLKGNIPCIGYGPQAQANCAKDRDSQIQKLHFMSPSGVDLEFFKGLSVWQDKDSEKRRGAFQKGSFQNWAYDYLNQYSQSKNTADCPADLSSHYMLDEDALKVSVLNSKAMGPRIKEKNGVRGVSSLMSYIFEKLEHADPEHKKASWNVAELAKVLDDGTGDGRFQWYTVDGDGVHDAGRRNLDELLGCVSYDADGNVVVGADGKPVLDGTDIEVRMVKTSNGDYVLDLVYTDPGLMSYRVANVSHTSKPELGRAARNNVIDAMTMATVQIRNKMGVAGSHAKIRKLLDFVSDWGVLITAMTSDSTFVDAVGMGNSQRLKELKEAGVPIGGMHWNNALAYEVFAQMKKMIGVPLYKVDSALNTAGALYDKSLNGGRGGWVDWSQDEFFRTLNKGSRVFSDSRRDGKFGGITRRLASCRVNVDDPGFRYMWRLADDYESAARQVLGDEEYDRITASSAYPEMDVIEAVMTKVRKSDHEWSTLYNGADSSDSNYKKAYATWRSNRSWALRMFTDHRGVSFEKGGQARFNEMVENVCFSDLFIPGGTDRVFDRSAVFDGRDDEDYIPEFGGKTSGGKRPVWLMGSTFGLPRTPSYNGSMWLQVVRASVPASEILVDEENGIYKVGRDAMVMPDPQTLEILGCDHDGDKAQVYLLSSQRYTGLADTIDLSDDAVKDADFARDPAKRRAYIERMMAEGIITRGDEKGLSIEPDTKLRCSNTYVQALFDMNRNIAVRRREDTDRADRPGLNEDYDFYRTFMARPTKFQPVDEADWEELKKSADQAKNFLKGHVIAEIDTACAVSMSAEKADKARGRIVSLAGLLHLAQFSGKFFDGSPAGTLFRWKKEDIENWIDFIYGVDGLSNATFDDIKEQICLQLGWEPDLIESVVADLIVSGEKAPTTSREFLGILKKHIEDIKAKRPRFWASVTADPADNGSLGEFRQLVNYMFNGGTLESQPTSMAIYRKDIVIGKLGISRTFKDGGVVYGYGDMSVLPDEVRRFMEAFKEDVQKYPPTGEYDDAQDCALSTVVDMVSARRGRNCASGMLAGSLAMIGNGADPAEVVRDFRQWVEGMRMIKFARDFTNSVNFLKSDPGSASYLAEQERLVGVFSQVMNRAPADSDVDEALFKMMCARRTAGEIYTEDSQGRAQNLHTIHSAMSLASANRTKAVVNFANVVVRRPRIGSDARELAVKLMAAEAQHGNLRLEANAETVQFFLAAMQTIPQAKSGTDVMSGNGGKDAWTTLRAMANAMNGAQSADDTTSDTRMVYGTTGDAIDLCNAFAAMFNVLSALWTTGSKSSANPAYGYFNTREDYHGLSGKDYSHDLYNSDESGAYRPVRMIGANFRQKDAVSYERARSWIKQVQDGALDPGGVLGSRTWRYEQGGKVKPADNFALSKTNLERFRGENLDEDLRRDVETVLDILESIKQSSHSDTDIEITPSAFIDQFLPVYSTMTQRVLGAPSPSNKSILGLIPGAFERVAGRQSAYERGALEPTGTRPAAGTGLMDAVLSTNYAVRNYTLTSKRTTREHKEVERDTGASDNGVRVALDIMGRMGERKTLPESLIEDDEVRQWREKELGGISYTRLNPEGTHLVDIFGNHGLLENLHGYANSVMALRRDESESAGPELAETLPSPEPAPADTDRSEKIAAFARHLQAVLPFATITYNGGNSIQVAGEFSGSMGKRFGGGKVSDFMIEFRIGEDPMTTLSDDFVNVNNPAFAASFCEATRGVLNGYPNKTLINADKFMRGLTAEERISIVKRLSGINFTKDGRGIGSPVRGYSVASRNWSIDVNGLATLLGYVNIADSEDYGTAYHELFHQMTSMFRTMGVFGDADIAALRRRFGEGAEGTDQLFDEEKAAEEFRRFVEHKIEKRINRNTGAVEYGARDLWDVKQGDQEDHYWVFNKIVMFLKALMNAIKKSFSYDDNDASDYLFGMMLSGYVSASAERREELGGGATEEEFEASVSEIADQTRTRDAMMSYLKSEMPDQVATLNDPSDNLVSGLKAMTTDLRNSGESYKDPMSGYVIENEFEQELHDLLISEMERNGVEPDGRPRRPRISVVADILKKLTDLRGLQGDEITDGSAAKLRVDSLVDEQQDDPDGETGGFRVTYDNDGPKSVMTSIRRGLARQQAVDRRVADAASAIKRVRLTPAQRSILEDYVNKTDAGRSVNLTPVVRVLADLGVTVDEQDISDVFAANELRGALSAGVTLHRDSIYGPVQNVLGAVVNARAIGEVTSDWKEIIDNVMNGQTFVERLAASGKLKDVSVEKLDRYMKTVRLGVNIFSKVSGRNGNANLMYRGLLTVYRDIYLAASRTVSSSDKAFALAGTYGKNVELASGKYRVTSADFAGALLAYSGVGPSEVLRRIRDEIVDAKAAHERTLAADAEPDRVMRTCDKLLASLADLDAFGDVTQLLEHRKDFGLALDRVLQNVFSGIRRGEWDSAEGRYGAYVPATEDSSDIAKDNKAVYGLDAGDSQADEIQVLLRDFADSVFTVVGALKFWRDAGMQPGTFHDSAFNGEPAEPAKTIQELCDEFGIGTEQMLGRGPLFDMTCRPEFIIGTFDQWYASTMADRIGKMDFRTAAMKNAGKFRGALAKLTRAENFLAHVYGVSRAENRNLYRLKMSERGFEFSDGFYHRIEDPAKKTKVVGFDVYGNMFKSDTEDISLTEDEWRTVDMVLKARTFEAMGDRFFLTGVSGHTGIHFTTGVKLNATTRTSEMSDGTVIQNLPSEDPEYYSWENVTELRRKVESGESSAGELPSIIWALWNLGQQWHIDVTGERTFTDRDGNERTYGLDLYDKLVDGIVRAVKKANSIVLREDSLGRYDTVFDRETSLRDTMEDQGSAMTVDDYNDIVLESLERDGLVVCDYRDTLFDGGHGRTSYTGGVRNRNVGAFVIPLKDIEEMFENSSAYDKLCRAGRDVKVDLDGKPVSILSAEYYIKKLMAPYRECLAEVRRNPWLTEGDGGFFNNLGTPIAFVEGGGMYMYRANRAMRKTKYEQILTIGAEERSFENVVVRMMKQGVRSIDEESTSKLNMLADYYGLDEHGEALRSLIKKGVYEPGSSESLRTGLELTRTADGNEIARAIYYKVLSMKLDALDGHPGPIPEQSLDRMIAMYETARDDGEVSVSGAGGITASMMFRRHGMLPKNFQLGHHLHESLKGITDALMFRSTLVNMLFLHGPNGKPMCFANPAEDAVARGGLSDDVWMAVARNLESAYGLKSDNTLTGVQRARKAYAALSGTFKDAGWKTPSGLRVHALAPEDMDCRSIEGFMAIADDPFDDNESDINRVKGTDSTAIGYAKQLFQSSRVLGGTARTQWIQRVLSWSKSASVAYSFFFPIATRWESPTGAVGFLATLGSNLSPDFVRKNSKALNKVQKVFTFGQKEGWLDQDFIGVKDIIRMMDTDDPFLADLVTWAESLNITMTDRLSNPLEPTKGLVEDDIRRMATILRETVEAQSGKRAGQQMEKRFTQMAEALFLRTGDRSFTYALNATKLAVTCQLAMKLKKEAVRRRKAFDPVRDLAKYATYIDSEIGGVNPLRYAWAHPMMRRALGYALFSWEWTRTAWEAGGGGVLEDMLFGGHTFTKQERKYILGRWLRMFGSIMIGVPLVTQYMTYWLARAMGWKDDDDRQWTWDNEDKTRWTAADITPLMKALGDKNTTLGQIFRFAKSVPVVGNLVPAYTGEDEANQSGASNRRYYIHMGKQGWEFFRWFTDPVGQVFSKLSMPTQRILEGVLGRSPSYLQRELPFSDQGSMQRLLDVVNPDGAWANFLKAFMPFTVNGVGSFSDAGFLSMIGPVQMGASQTAVLTRIKNAMRSWALNDRRGYRFGGRAGVSRTMLLADVLEDAKRNGHDVSYLQTRAVGQLAPELYAKLFKALPKKVTDDFDVREVSRIIRALHRLGVRFDGLRRSVRTRFKAKGVNWKSMPRPDRQLIDHTMKTLWGNPFEKGASVFSAADDVYADAADAKGGVSYDY